MYPLALNIGQRLCVVVGGGRVAERKVRSILAAGGRVRLVSPAATPGLTALADCRAIEWICKPYSQADLDGAFLAFAATNNPETQRAVHRDAQAAGLLVNIADAPDLCDFQVPATIHRGDLAISVATGGKSPAVAAMVKRRLDRFFGEEYGLLTAFAALLREQILAEELDSDRTRVLFQQLLHDDLVDWLRDRRWDDIRRHVEQVRGRPVAFDLESLTKEDP